MMKSEVRSPNTPVPVPVSTAARQNGRTAERQDGVKRAVQGCWGGVGRGGLTITQKYACMHGRLEKERERERERDKVLGLGLGLGCRR